VADEPCTDCPDEFAAVTADDETQVDAETDPRGTNVTRWGPQLIAPYDKPTGDKRRFAAASLTNRDLPLPVKWQRVDDQGHKSSIVVGTMDHVDPREDGVYGSGLLLDPDPEQLPRLAEDVGEVRALTEAGILGPSVDLDDMEFRALDEPQVGELAAGEGQQRPAIEVTRGRISAVTLVQIPAFAEVGPLQLSEMPAEEYAAMTEAMNSVLTAAVNTAWDAVPLAPAGTAFDAINAVSRVRAWAAGDPERYATAFLWADPDKRERTLFPLADVINGELAIVPEAINRAQSYLDKAALPGADLAAMRRVLGDLDEAALAQEISQLGAGDVDELAELAEGVGTFGPRFDALVAKLGGKVADPAAVAAKIGLAKYGKKGMARLAAGVSAKKVKPLHGARIASGALEAMTAAALAGDWSTITEEHMTALTAAAGTQVPAAYRRSAFENPKLAAPTPLTITDDGRVYGHVADWKTCHTGFAGCVRAPKSKSGYSYFHVGEVLTDDGRLPVGKLTVGGGHADTRLGFRAAAEHYDNADASVAVVRAGEDKFGIWVAGELRHGADPGKVEQLMQSPLSGDWRTVGGHLEMIAALGVNSGGFPIPRVALTASGAVDPEDEDQVISLVAAGVIARPQTGTQGVDIESVARLAARYALEGQAAFARQAKASALLAGMDDTADQQDGLKRKRRALKAVAAMRSGSDSDYA
jgi:hypothetical protein